MYRKQDSRGFTLVEGLLLILVITVISFAGWYVWNNGQDDKTDDNARTTATTKKQQSTNTQKDDGLTPYENKEIGVAFRYPAEWGTVHVEPNTSAATGKGYYVKFSNKNNVGASFSTKDFTVNAGRGGAYYDAPTTFALASENATDHSWDGLDATKIYEKTSTNILYAQCESFNGSIALEQYTKLNTQYDVGYFYYLLGGKEGIVNAKSPEDCGGDIDKLFAPAKAEFTPFISTIKAI